MSSDCSAQRSGMRMDKTIALSAWLVYFIGAMLDFSQRCKNCRDYWWCYRAQRMKIEFLIVVRWLESTQPLCLIRLLQSMHLTSTAMQIILPPIFRQSHKYTDFTELNKRTDFFGINAAIWRSPRLQTMGSDDSNVIMTVYEDLFI
jgi:hypothetical protein